MIKSEEDLRWRHIPEGAKESHWVAQDGAKIRRIDWEMHPKNKPLGSLLFLPGRGDHYEKYLETLDYWAQLGWRVTSIDWRGQGLSGRLLANPRIGHIDDFSTWINDLRYFWQFWKDEGEGPNVVVGHSMGGHLTMRALAEGCIDPKAVALSAPMLGIRSNGLPVGWAHAFSRFMVRIGKGEQPAWKESEKPMSPMSLRKQILTHSRRRYEDEMFWWKERPDVRLGPPSWHWLERAIDSTIKLDGAEILGAIKTPILLLATRADQLVDTKRIIADHNRLPNSEIVLFGREAAHELLREADNVRNICLDSITRHFEKFAPPSDRI